MTDENKILSKNNENIFWTISKSMSFLLLIFFTLLKLYNSEIKLTIDAPTFLSILLALFSVALSATFYFKATDTSNKFYDNSYKYTKDVAQLLVKIESGFGERLKKLDEGYLSMRDEIQKIPVYGNNGGDNLKQEIEETKKELISEKKELEKIKKDRDSIIKEMIEKSELLQGEKDNIIAQLSEKEREANEAQEQVIKLNKRLFAERMSKKDLNFKNNEILDRVKTFTHDLLENEIDTSKTKELSLKNIRNIFNNASHKLPNKYFEDMLDLGYVTKDLELTLMGASFIASLIKNKL